MRKLPPYFALTPKGLRLATTNPKLASVVNYVSSSEGVTTLTTSGVKAAGARVASSAAAKTAAGTIAKGATQLATRAAAQTAATAAGTGTGAAAGTGILPVIGTIIGAVVGFFIGAVVGNWSKIKHEANEGIMATTALGVTLFNSVGGFAVGTFNAVLGAIAAATAESAKGLIIIVLTVPIILAFFLFIINSGAYIVPPSSMVFNPGGPNSTPVFGYPTPPPASATISCPLLNWRLGPRSYDGNEGQNPQGFYNHGSSGYWTVVMGPPYCRFSLPQIAANCSGPVNTSNICHSTAPDRNCPYYGYALDIFPNTAGITKNGPIIGVYAPSINGSPTTWSYDNFTFSNGNNGSSGYSYRYRSGIYRLLFTHMSNVGINLGSTISSGQVVGSLFNCPNGSCGNTHLHVEMTVSGAFVRPEDWLCT
ncbi:MAG: hypothetical protein G01um101416_1115 [Microgenomates group bacterium Gr01-1014_16]|nr:MAG: hypothetical protein G01um101416_1115 [Microgenomates group bacterium Gr01-1014_16]